MKKRLMLFVMLSLALAGSFAAPKDQWPRQTITMVVPFGAGGSTDLLARMLAKAAQGELGVPVIISNVVGGSGTVGTTQVAQAAPDGYTIEFVASGPLLTQPWLLPDLKYSLSDFQGIVGVSSDTSCIVVPASSKYKTIVDLINEKSKVIGGNTGAGTLHHLLQVAFFNKTGTPNTLVPFQGGAALNSAILGNQVNFGTSTPAEYIQSHKSGEVHILAVASSKRLAKLPDVPTFKESGLDIDLSLEFFLIAPAGLPKEVAAALEMAFMKAAKTKEVVDFVNTIGQDLNIRGGDELMKKLESDYKIFGELMTQAGISKR